jgi:addiction module HigA family antidote
MIPSNRIATHSGVILLKEFLEPLKITQKALAMHLGVSIQRINETAWLLSESFNTSPEFWLNLQSVHDLSANRPDNHIQPLHAVGI